MPEDQWYILLSAMKEIKKLKKFEIKFPIKQLVICCHFTAEQLLQYFT